MRGAKYVTQCSITFAKLNNEGEVVMADLRTEFCGVRFKNPVLAASAEPTLSAENMKRVIETGAGGLVAKTVTDSEAMRRLTKMSKWRYLDEQHNVCRGCGICTCVCPVPGAVNLQGNGQ